MLLLRITDRYIFREVVTVWLMVTFVLLFFLFSNVVAKLLARAAANEFARESLGVLLGLTSIRFLATLIPFALFLAMMLALGRMYQDSEMPIYQACGIGPKTYKQGTDHRGRFQGCLHSRPYRATAVQRPAKTPRCPFR